MGIEDKIMSEKRKKSKKISAKLLILFILYEFVFIAITSPFILFYGPFDNLKKAAIYTVEASQHRYVLSWFLSKSYLDKFTSVAASSNVVSQDMTKVKVSNASKNVSLYKITDDRYDAYIMEISSPKRIKAVMTKYEGKKGEKTSDMAKEHNAIAAINGGTFYDSTGQKYAGTGATPGGFVISNGEPIFHDVGMDEGVQDVTAFTADGHLIVGEHSINYLKSKNVSEAVTFRGSPLIVDGKGQITDPAADGYNPRTAVGQKSDGTVLFLVVDGRKSFTKWGASLYDLQKILLDHGAVNASNLDGGDSATLYYSGKIINSPNVWDGERSVATAFVVEP